MTERIMRAPASSSDGRPPAEGERPAEAETARIAGPTIPRAPDVAAVVVPVPPAAGGGPSGRGHVIRTSRGFLLYL